jgi:plasmid stability protein
MATTMTKKPAGRNQLNLSNFPDRARRKLAVSAEANKRSMSQEAAALLEEILAIKKITAKK